ncbi:MAG TPA: HEAT repeat domain-containing protein [Candidatus Acidoferrales bacterium]|nr:HEAT repeat domain-containing protein [Candidatus Acidoferrales bacterium]
MITRQPVPGPQPDNLSPAARNLAPWWREVDQLLRLARALGPDAPAVEQQRARLVEAAASLVKFHAPLVLRCAPEGLLLRDELVALRAFEDAPADAAGSGIPALLEREGVRSLTLDSRTSQADVQTLLAALIRSAVAPAPDHDMVTDLWSADLDGLIVEVAPLYELLTTGGEASADGRPPASSQVPADMVPPRDLAGADEPTDAAAAWSRLAADEDAARQAWEQARIEDAARQWPERLERLEQSLAQRAPGPATGEALVAALAGWLVGAMRRADWIGATQAIEGLRRADPDREWSGTQLARSLGELDADAMAERLDESAREDIQRFFALAVRIGRPAIDLVVRVMAHAERPRVRAAATSTLGYLGAEDPRALAPYVRDPRWQVARNVVFALGQVGGEEVGRALASSLLHSDARVRRAAVESLGQVPVHRRTPLLVSQLDVADSNLLGSVLAMLLRDPAPTVLPALLERVARTDFDARPEESRLALIGALGELHDDRAVPALRERVNAGGWFAKRTPERRAAARALVTLGTPAAIEVLREGQRSRAEAVRADCQEALSRTASEAAA